MPAGLSYPLGDLDVPELVWDALALELTNPSQPYALSLGACMAKVRIGGALMKADFFCTKRPHGRG